MYTLRAQTAHGLLPSCVLASLFIAISPWSAFSQTSTQATPAVAQTTNPSSAPVTPTLSTTVDEVSLDLVAHEKNGRPILDLTPSDVEITDDGAPVKLSDMHLVTGAAQSNHLVTFLFDRLEAGPAKTARELAAKMMKAIPISSELHPREMIHSLHVASDALRNGELVCIFAEGQITRTGQLLPFRRGLERIMKGVDVPIIPVNLDGVWGKIGNARPQRSSACCFLSASACTLAYAP